MSSTSQQRYFANHLQLIPTDHETLTKVLPKLREGILIGLQLIERYSSRSRLDGGKDSMYTGDSGIALMYMRLHIQAGALDLPPDVRDSLTSYAVSHLPRRLSHHEPRAGHISPLDSHIGPAILIILHELRRPTSFDDSIWNAAVSTFKGAVEIASTDERIGGDEVLYGRAGLLWGMLNVLKCIDAEMGERQRWTEISGIVEESTIEKVVRKIIQVGELGAKIYRDHHDKSGPPLIWMWHDKCYLGAIHGTAGILTVLLQCPRSIIRPHLDLITTTITHLTTLASYNGHLPTSLPAKHRSDSLVQICHGSPGLLLLLSTFRGKFPNKYLLDWDDVERKASRAIWEEGLVRKGLGVCHGVTGNAWPWLLRAHTEAIVISDESDGESKARLRDLARALSFMVHATELPPVLKDPLLPYNTPDHPYSLFEGLAGAICAWADTCAVIKACLEKKETVPVLGLPGLGGLGPAGII